MGHIFTKADGTRYEARIIIQGSPQDKTHSACDLCDLRNNCNKEECQLWRERSTSTFSCLPRTYFKRIE